MLRPRSRGSLFRVVDDWLAALPFSPVFGDGDGETSKHCSASRGARALLRPA